MADGHKEIFKLRSGVPEILRRVKVNRLSKYKASSGKPDPM